MVHCSNPASQLMVKEIAIFFLIFWEPKLKLGMPKIPLNVILIASLCYRLRIDWGLNLFIVICTLPCISILKIRPSGLEIQHQNQTKSGDLCLLYK